MTDYMQKARELLNTTSWFGGDLQAIVASTLEALDTERAAHEATKAELQALREALRVIQSAAQQSGHWPPQRRDATLEGIEKVANRALEKDA